MHKFWWVMGADFGNREMMGRIQRTQDFGKHVEKTQVFAQILGYRLRVTPSPKKRAWKTSEISNFRVMHLAFLG